MIEQSIPTKGKGKKKIAAIFLVIIMIVVIIAVVFSASNPDFLWVTNKVQIKVDYSGHWEGGYSNNDPSSYEKVITFGPYTATMDVRTDVVDFFIISANARKLDGGSETLTLSLVKMDGTVLEQVSTNDENYVKFAHVFK